MPGTIRNTTSIPDPINPLFIWFIKILEENKYKLNQIINNQPLNRDPHPSDIPGNSKKKYHLKTLI